MWACRESRSSGPHAAGHLQGAIEGAPACAERPRLARPERPDRDRLELVGDAPAVLSAGAPRDPQGVGALIERVGTGVVEAARDPEHESIRGGPGNEPEGVHAHDGEVPWRRLV